MIARIGRTYRFEAAHRLAIEGAGDEENWRIYGKCSREGGHGHNYEVCVVLEGEIPEATGMLMDRREMDARVDERLVSRVDHRNLNDVVEGVPTGEVLARTFHEWLAPAFTDGPRLARVSVIETPRNRFDSR